jgi:hypothetical protein
MVATVTSVDGSTALLVILPTLKMNAICYVGCYGDRGLRLL